MVADCSRYQRHMELDGFGPEGQIRLAKSRVLVVGAGGLGSPVLTYLAAAGVGTLGVCDGDLVDESNLNRQILHGTGSLGLLKVDSAAARIADLNPLVSVIRYPERVDTDNLTTTLAGWDLVMDCTDRFEARFLISDWCWRNRVPLIEAGVFGWEGLVYSVLTWDGPCYRCLFPESPSNEPSGAPVAGTAAGMTGVLMAQEALRHLLGAGSASGTLYRLDMMAGGFRKLVWPERASCFMHEK